MSSHITHLAIFSRLRSPYEQRIPDSWHRWQVGRWPLHLAFWSRQFSQARLTRPLLVQVLVLTVRGMATLEFAARSPGALWEVPAAEVSAWLDGTGS